MLRAVLSFIVATLILLPATAWSDSPSEGTSRVDLGLHVGLTMANFGGEVGSDFEREYKPGVFGGASVVYHLTDVIAVQTELAFIGKGNRTKGPSAGSSLKSYYDYLEIPLLLQAALPVSERVIPHVVAGPAVAILLDADATFDDGRSFEINDNVETIDFGLMAGIGVAVALGRDSGAIVIDARYDHGLRNWNVFSTDDSDEVFNRAFYITAGYRADLGALGLLFGGG